MKTSLIPDYPERSPIVLDMGEELVPITAALPEGHCELLFGSMFLYRNKYRYTISRLAPGTYVLFGEDKHMEEGIFFTLFGAIPDMVAILPLFDDILPGIAQRPWKQMSESFRAKLGGQLVEQGFTVTPDRDNFDYLYLRSDLAALSGKRFHKKKNLVNAFNNAYTGIVQTLNRGRVQDAKTVLDTWEATRGGDEVTDYSECTEALDNLEVLGLDGVVIYVEGKPVGFSLGESLAAGRMYCTHFEKALDDYKGVFQFVNQAAARALPETVEFINREQDVGDEGLRQAKLTYRPARFVEKYTVKKHIFCL
jgi:hypothetical protein